jgi:HEAT repeat protein
MQALIGGLQHTDKNVRARAAVDLGTLADPRATTALVQALGAEPEFFVREYLTWALVRMGDRAVAPLIELVGDASPRARHGAVHTLSKIGDPRAGEALILALRDADLSVVTKAAYALGELQCTAAIPALVELAGREERELLALQNFGRAVLRPLIESLGHPHWRVREQAANILGVLAQVDAVPALLRAFEDAEWQVRLAAVHSAGTLDGTEAGPAVTGMLNDPDPRVRAMASRFAPAGRT